MNFQTKGCVFRADARSIQIRKLLAVENKYREKGINIWAINKAEKKKNKSLS
jgi:hypothetical protein